MPTTLATLRQMVEAQRAKRQESDLNIQALETAIRLLERQSVFSETAYRRVVQDLKHALER